ncbi:MAG: TolC family protein [Planctomycetota bacterium]
MTLCRTLKAAAWPAVLAFGLLALGPGCDRNLREIDAEVERLLGVTSGTLGLEAPPPGYSPETSPRIASDVESTYAAEQLDTRNPNATDLTYLKAEDDIERVLNRLIGYGDSDVDPLNLDLQKALSYAMANSRDYQFEEERYVLTALNLLQERHLWGPRFFNDVQADITGSGDDGTFDTALRLVNDFRVTQRLPYGGEVSARALATATEDLHQFVSGEKSQSVDVILDAEIPLLRGAGIVAREDRIQAERNMIYAARTFERFRRNFVLTITSDFLSLVVRKQAIANAEQSVRDLLDLTDEQRSRQREGLTDVIDSGLAEQRYLQALDSLNSQQEFYRVELEQFKVTIGMPIDQPIGIEESTLGLPVPSVTLNDAVRAAMSNRLDLQTVRDQLNDTRRAIANAENDLLPDLDLIGSISIPTDDDLDRSGLQFEPDSNDFTAGVRFGLPLDREIQRITVREAQIAHERAVRAYEEFVDTLAVNVRSAVRDIDRAQFSLQIQAEGIKNAEVRFEAAELDETSTSRDRSEAVDDLNAARDDFDSAYRDLQLAILRYLLETGQLRVGNDGQIVPLSGMTLNPEADPSEEAAGSDDFDLIEGIRGLQQPEADESDDE